MAEKEMQPPHPVISHPQTGDTEAAAAARKKNKRKFTFIIALIVVYIIVIDTTISLTILKARNPKFRIQQAAVTNFNGGTPATLTIEFSVSNSNFGRYHYPRATVVFTRRQGVEVGIADVADSSVGWRDTQKFKLDVELNLGKNLSTAAFVPISAQAKLAGRAEIIFILTEMKGADLSCNMDIVRATQQIVNIGCE